jgi:hypothetical protein
MTEAEWLACTDPAPMLEFLRAQRTTSERKLRLFAAACCRRVWDWLGEKSRRAVDVLERYVDGLASTDELRRAAGGAQEDWLEDFGHHHPSNAVYFAVQVQEATAHHAALWAAAEVAEAVRIEAGQQGMTAERVAQCDLLREVFHGPCRPVYVRGSWRTGTVLSLASTIYSERKFRELPVLADALEDVGCEETDILNHCRSTAGHVPGCWVLDVLTGRS